MAKKTENTIETLEQALELIALKDDLIAKLEAELAEKQTEIEAIQEKTTVLTKEVHGIYKSKEHGVTVRFKKGFVNTRIKGSIVSSSEIIKNKDGKYTEFLDHLIEISSGVLEVVKKK